MSIGLICLDFDGVCADLREVHFHAFNSALAEIDPKFIITADEHNTVYDGLSTKRKLELLSTNKGLPHNVYHNCYKRKQELTISAIEKHITINTKLISLLTELKNRKYILCLASNAVYPTLKAGLTKLGILDLFDKIYSNTDTINQKPHPEVYLRCMVDMGFGPDETLIVEDSKHGREAARRSGAFVCGVDSPDDLTLSKIENALNVKPTPIKWVGGGINVLCPMSGMGSRFTQQGYKLPKPLIDVAGKPMIQRVIENMPIDGRFIFVVQKAHFENYYLGTLLNSIAPECEIITVDGMTDGAARTCLLAKEFINNDEHLIIANSDQFVQWDPCSFMWSMIGNTECDGQILTFKDTNPKWSFAKVESGWVSEVAEKRPISDQATVGIYAFKRGQEFVKYAEQMISKNIRTNGEFYVCPVFNEFIGAGKKIKTFGCNGMYGMGTPEDLETTLQSKIFE